jgi:hypothetical protein
MERCGLDMVSGDLPRNNTDSLLRPNERKSQRWCFAKKAAAFVRMSRSSWRMRFSRRSRVSSSRSADVRPVRPFVRSACACLTVSPRPAP